MAQKKDILPHTQAIYIWRPFDSAKYRDGANIVFMDSSGLGREERAREAFCAFIESRLRLETATIRNAKDNVTAHQVASEVGIAITTCLGKMWFIHARNAEELIRFAPCIHGDNGEPVTFKWRLTGEAEARPAESSALLFEIAQTWYSAGAHFFNESFILIAERMLACRIHIKQRVGEFANADSIRSYVKKNVEKPFLVLTHARQAFCFSEVVQSLWGCAPQQYAVCGSTAVCVSTCISAARRVVNMFAILMSANVNDVIAQLISDRKFHDNTRAYNENVRYVNTVAASKFAYVEACFNALPLFVKPSIVATHRPTSIGFQKWFMHLFRAAFFLNFMSRETNMTIRSEKECELTDGMQKSFLRTLEGLDLAFVNNVISPALFEVKQAYGNSSVMSYTRTPVEFQFALETACIMCTNGSIPEVNTELKQIDRAQMMRDMGINPDEIFQE